MISLFLSVVLNGAIVQTNTIDNVKFNTVNQCEVYKARMAYTDTKVLKFNCKKG